MNDRASKNACIKHKVSDLKKIVFLFAKDKKFKVEWKLSENCLMKIYNMIQYKKKKK